mmetsp:Transcript_115494/g.162357  ORF Transcript_115494/g.162357 Transcript_115494/m.162357 type:complete len:90 (+) Transcript_115494:58-327(+)
MSRWCCCFQRWQDSDSSSSEEILSDDEADYLYFPPKTYDTASHRADEGTQPAAGRGVVNLPPPVVHAAKSLRSLDASPSTTPQQKPGAR